MQTLKRILFPYCLIFSLSFLLFSCAQKNYLEKYNEPPEIISARNDLESRSYTSAHAKLTNILEKDATDYTARSLLAACEAGIGGIVIADIILGDSITTIQKAASSGSIVGITSALLRDLFPPVTTAMLDQMVLANAEMAMIPASDITAKMLFQQSTFLAFYGLIQLLFMKAEHISGLALTSTESDTYFNSMTTLTALTPHVNPIKDVALLLFHIIELMPLLPVPPAGMANQVQLTAFFQLGLF